jgi:uncharacterized protein (DUF2062 family)
MILRPRRLGLRLILAFYRAWRRLRKKTIHVMLEENASPEQIALGCALGMFVAGLPCLGLQMITAGLVASAIGANRLAAVTFVWASNPLGFYVQYLVGKQVLLLVDLPVPRIPPLGWKNMLAVLTEVPGVLLAIGVGAVPVGLTLGAMTYFVALAVIRRFKAMMPARAGQSGSGGEDRGESEHDEQQQQDDDQGRDEQAGQQSGP